MDEFTREEMQRDVEIDGKYRKYRVKVMVEFDYITHATSMDEAEDEAYDAIEEALRGSHLDFNFDDFDTEEME